LASALISRAALLGFALLAVSGCVQGVRRGAVMPPDSAWAGCWRRLEDHSSFRFRLEYRTDSPLAVSAQYSGLWLAPDREAWDGDWTRGGERRAVRLRAAGDQQYDFAGDTWAQSLRGVETRIIEQLRQVVRDPRPKLESSTDAAYIFTFNPGLRFLDPAGAKHFSGQAEVDARLGVPLRVTGVDSAGTAACTFEFFDFDRPGRIELPFVSGQTVELEPVRRMPLFSRGRTQRAIKVRLERMGWVSRAAWRGRVLRLQLEEGKPGHVVSLLAQRGLVEVWQCRRAGGDSPEQPGTALSVGGDASQRVVLEQRVGSNAELLAEVLAPLPVSPVLRVRTAGAVPGQLAALVVDGQALALATIAESGVIDFGDIGSIETVRALAALTATRPLPVGLGTAGRP
jgi:hypothetical protein